MGVILEVRDLKALAQQIRHKKNPEAKQKFVEMMVPISRMISERYPLFLQEDLEQEIGVWLLERADDFARRLLSKKVKNLSGFLYRSMENYSKDWIRSRMKEECRYVSLDDLQLQDLTKPKTYPKSKILKKLKAMVEKYYRVRYGKKAVGKRVSRFLYAILDGKRPSFSRNNLVEFGNMHPDYAKEAYTVTILMLRRILKEMEDDL